LDKKTGLRVGQEDVSLLNKKAKPSTQLLARLGEPAVRAGEPVGRTWGNLRGRPFPLPFKM